MSEETKRPERRPRRLVERCEPMPSRFDPLATYNAERYRGVMHTPEWQAKMADLQREFDAWALGLPTA